MMAPHYERVRALAVVLEEVERALPAPVESLRETPDHVFLADGGGWRMAVSFAYQNACSTDGAPMPGSGHWYARPGIPRPRNPLLALASRVAGRRHSDADKRDRIQQIEVAIRAALDELQDPIDALEVRGDLVEVRSGAQSLRIRCRRETPGGGNGGTAWSGEVEPAPAGRGNP